MQYRLRDINLAVVAGELPVGQTIGAVREFNQTAARPIESVLCPGLGTAVGRMHPRACAEQMYFAYRTAHEGRLFLPPDLVHACRNQFDLTKR